MLDIGCGPMTSALALADLYRDRFDRPLPLNYIGIDISKKMLALAEKFAKRDDCFSPSRGGYIRLRESVDRINDRRFGNWIRDATDVVISLSYVLAQVGVEHKDVDKFAATVARICERAGDRSVWLVYTNAASLYHNKLQYFIARCKQLGAEFDSASKVTVDHPFRQHRLAPNRINLEMAKSKNLEYLVTQLKKK